LKTSFDFFTLSKFYTMQDFSNEFEQPTNVESTRHDFSKNPLAGKQPIQYASGKLEQVSAKMYFDGKIPHDELLCGFKYYNPETKTKTLLSEFTAFVIGVYYGSFSNGKERGDINYQSNLVADTRTDILHSFYFMRSGDNYEIKTLALGNYKADIAPAIEAEGRGSSYTKVLVAYIKELGEIRAIHLNSTAEAGFVKAIAKSQDIAEHKASLYRIGELASEIWVFKFSGQFEPVIFSTKEAKSVGATVPAQPGAKALFFQPVLQAGVIRQTSEKWRETYNEIAQMQLEFSDYIQSEQNYYFDRLKKGGKEPVSASQVKPPAQPANTDPNFPTADVTSYGESGDNGDDLPF